MTEDRNEIKAWLDVVIATDGDTATGIARRAGVSPSTLTRFLKDPQNAPLIKAGTLAKISHATRVSLPSAAVREPASIDAAVAATPRGMSEAEALPLRLHGDRDAHLAKVVDEVIGGRKSADPWRLRSRALELAGYMPDDILIVDLAEQPASGDVVCAQVYRWRENRAETVFRFFEPPYLVAASSDPAVRRPLWVDNESVMIKGVVIALYRPRAGRAGAPA